MGFDFRPIIEMTSVMYYECYDFYVIILHLNVDKILISICIIITLLEDIL